MVDLAQPQLDQQYDPQELLKRHWLKHSKGVNVLGNGTDSKCWKRLMIGMRRGHCGQGI